MWILHPNDPYFAVHRGGSRDPLGAQGSESPKQDEKLCWYQPCYDCLMIVCASKRAEAPLSGITLLCARVVRVIRIQLLQTLLEIGHPIVLYHSQIKAVADAAAVTFSRRRPARAYGRCYKIGAIAVGLSRTPSFVKPFVRR